MITVENVLNKNKKEAAFAGEQNEELLKTGTIKAKQQSYVPWIIIGGLAIAAGIWLWVKGKKDNGAISG